jgi:hypothetical protein
MQGVYSKCSYSSKTNCAVGTSQMQGVYSRNWSFFLTYWMRTTKKVLQHDVLQLGKATERKTYTHK